MQFNYFKRSRRDIIYVSVVFFFLADNLEVSEFAAVWCKVNLESTIVEDQSLALISV